MVARKRVGLIFSYNEKWIAGAYYILNIIHALNTIHDNDKPEIFILTDSLQNFKKVKKETKYPYLKYSEFPSRTKYNLLERVINKAFRIVFNNNLINKKPKYPTIDFLYPNQVNALSEDIQKVNWIPDFQEDYLPQYFSDEEIKNRKKTQKTVFAKGDVVVFSSNDAKNDFIRLYPESNAKFFVLPFAVTHPNFSNEDINQLLSKYNLPNKYFFVPNQFWAHKNHIVVLEALKVLNDKGKKITIAMSGNEDDYRNKDNFNLLKQFVVDNNLQEQVKFLGFLPRDEQLCLFKHAKAIIQPSLFEGWSTVVEDAKALNKFLILSELNVHKEQVTDNVKFFNPNDSIQLADLLIDYITNPIEVKEKDYNKKVIAFGNEFNRLINEAS